MPYRRTSMGMLVVFCAFVATACGDASDPTRSEVKDREAKSTQASSSSRPEGAEPLPEAIDLADAVLPLRLAVGSRSGYLDADGVLIMDVLEGDSVYASLWIRDSERRPVRGLRPTITPEGDSRVILISGEEAVSDDAGEYPFGLVGGTMGEERVEIQVGEFGGGVILNVISQRAAAGYGWMDEIEGALDWDLLFQAEVEWGEQQLFATFPDEIKAKSGQTVKLAGFMMPLETATKQSHFVLTSSPPGCYFHLPGGPAGAVEVFATKPLEVGWDPVVLEGRFEALESSEMGVVYRLHEARPIDEVPSPPEV